MKFLNDIQDLRKLPNIAVALDIEGELVGCHSDKDLVKRIMKGYNTLVRRLNSLLSERENWIMQTNKE